MKPFLTIITFILIAFTLADQQIHIRILQNDSIKREREVYVALTIANEAKSRLRANMDAFRLNEAKMLQVAKNLGLKNYTANLSMGGE